ncbi:GntR family transcriptional regulator [bacterium RCC_150]
MLQTPTTQGFPAGERGGDSSAAEHVYSWLRSAIINGRLVAGERYSIYRLADELGVSRTPAREAVLKLANLGVIEIERNRGFVVRSLRVEEVRANHEARILLEVPAARAAAKYPSGALIDKLYHHLKRINEAMAQNDHESSLAWDRALHTEILSAGGNSRVVSLAAELRDSSVQAWDVYSSPLVNKNDHSEVEGQHYAIVDAIRDSQPQLAAKTMQTHLEANGLFLMRHVAEINNEPFPVRFSGRMLE